MSFVQLKDNNYKGAYLKNTVREITSDYEKVYKDIAQIANTPLSEIIANNNSLLIFPFDLESSKDKIGELPILQIRKNESDISESKLYTNNLMGFIGIGETQISISSRFCKNTGKDFFLQYMLSKVFNLNLFDLNFSIGKNGYFDLLYLMFPVLLKNAGKKGIYREYKSFKKNDSKVKGIIDIKRYINHNIPFDGNISYNVREYTYDNYVTQLIRHTIEYIKSKSFGIKALSLDSEITRIVNQICLYTPSYSKNERQKIINKNLKHITHPYYKEYLPLQKLCLQILRNDKIFYQEDKQRIYGILFDGAWLWEEFLFTVLAKYNKSILHPRNKIGTDGIHLFSNSRTNYYPDFRLPKKNNKHESDIILDAKYKDLHKDDSDDDFSDVRIPFQREDKFQMISYMHVQNANRGIFLYPYKYMKVSDNEKPQLIFSKKMHLNGLRGDIYSIGFPIIQSAKNLSEYSKKMDKVVNTFNFEKK